ncbi:glycosyltransferase family 2 protein [Sinorhizobium medicae]|uniref:Succinoglycan biosynthesis protein ExoU n=1 Tax=Sinorhizobium medicae TaxID=110321 RepID=A0A508X6L4_9HYPH|nr:glycosyltransferase family 2 protein [Sinorhizobium medicae]MDX0635740.1 glycosyltransferase [Sinorhizobium medicae]RVI94299.1 glycosyltransferase family 2 protein [Sinorhizobium medicae]VTZ64581.1 Succinoglycan biosynthesis protein ExoU [Sinorhizobium medicae]
MTAAVPTNVCIIIAAKNAADTIARAVSSALAEPEAAEVVVIDDGSTDDSAAVARAADDGSGRLNVVRFEENRGPAAARNHAIEISKSQLLGVLDADDFLFPGRLRQLLSQEGWDFIADNIAFIDAAQAANAQARIDRFAPAPRLIDLVGFIEGNISRRGVRRGEIGFLKPLMRRAFLDQHGLRYNETLRLGEDYDLYARALAKGARYKIIHSCGYAAVVRGDSLSGSHRTIDLKRLYEADRAILAGNKLSSDAEAALRRHERHIRDRYELRHFLDLKNQRGFARAISYALTHPAALPAILGGILSDKTERFRPSRAPAPLALGGTGDVRYLLEALAMDQPQK